MKSDKISVFDFINCIFDKTEMPDEELFKKYYTPYIVNTYLSFFREHIFIANALNMNWNISPEQHFLILFNGLDKSKKRTKWIHRDKGLAEKIKLLKDLYQYSTRQAREIIPMIDRMGLWKSIKEELYKGGKTKN